MAEVLVTFTTPTRAKDGDLYYARVLGRKRHDGLYEGWLEFMLAGSDEVILTQRETEQPNRTDLKYWAEGLTAVYLEGALERALHPTAVTARGTAPEVEAGRRSATEQRPSA